MSTLSLERNLIGRKSLLLQVTFCHRICVDRQGARIRLWAASPRNDRNRTIHLRNLGVVQERVVSRVYRPHLRRTLHYLSRGLRHLPLSFKIFWLHPKPSHMSRVNPRHRASQLSNPHYRVPTPLRLISSLPLWIIILMYTCLKLIPRLSSRASRYHKYINHCHHLRSSNSLSRKSHHPWFNPRPQ